MSCFIKNIKSKNFKRDFTDKLAYNNNKYSVRVNNEQKNEQTFKKIKQNINFFSTLILNLYPYSLLKQEKKKGNLKNTSKKSRNNLKNKLTLLITNTICLLNFLINLISNTFQNLNVSLNENQNHFNNKINKRNKAANSNSNLQTANAFINFKKSEKFSFEKSKQQQQTSFNTTSKLLLLIFLFSTLITKTNAKGLCGNITNPKGSNECLPFSTENFFCCLLTIENSPSDFNTCYVVEKDTASSTVIQIGKITYKVDCSGIPNFYRYFPFEEKFKPCSTSNPKSISTCTDFKMENNAKCCLGIIKSYPDIRKCYSSIGLSANTINYTTSYGDEITLFCAGNYVSFVLGNFSVLVFFLVLFLFGLF